MCGCNEHTYDRVYSESWGSQKETVNRKCTEKHVKYRTEIRAKLRLSPRKEALVYLQGT